MEKIELDISPDMTLHELYKWCKEHGVKPQIITLFGPGGGYPVIEFEGPRECLISFMKDYGIEDDEMEEFFD